MLGNPIKSVYLKPSKNVRNSLHNVMIFFYTYAWSYGRAVSRIVSTNLAATVCKHIVSWIPNIALRILYTYALNYGMVSRIFGTIVTATVCKHSVINSYYTNSRNKFKIEAGILTFRQVFWSHFDIDSCCICSPDIQHRCLQTVAVTFDRNSLRIFLQCSLHFA